MGVILTEEVLAQLNVETGDTLYLTEAIDGGYCLTAYDPEPPHCRGLRMGEIYGTAKESARLTLERNESTD